MTISHPLITDQHPRFKEFLKTPLEWDREEALEPTDRDIIHELLEYGESWHALGLSAPQIGYKRPIFVMKKGDGNPLKVVLFPIIESKNDLFCSSLEGCFSLPGEYYRVSRPTTIKVSYGTMDEDGFPYLHDQLLHGHDARVFLHEYDHLKGTLISDIGHRNYEVTQ